MHARLRRPAAALITTTLAASVLGIAPAAHAADGTLTGTVSGAGGDLDNVRVTLYQREEGYDSWEETGDSVYAETDGSWSMTVPAGDYRVGFEDYSDHFAEEYYNDADEVDAPEAVTVTVPGAGPLDAELATAAHLSGAVTSSSDELFPGITVSLYRAVRRGGSDAYRLMGFALTDEAGRYDIGGVAGGRFILKFEDDSATYATEYYLDQPSIHTAPRITVGDGEIATDFDAQLDAASVISGEVTDGDGAAVANGFVTAYTKVGEQWLDVVDVTIEDGSYAADQLSAGTYRMRFVANFDDGQAVEFWQDSRTVEDADDIVLDAPGSTQVASAELVYVEPAVENVSLPMVTGTPVVGSTLSASTGTWSEEPDDYDYEWYADGEYIPYGWDSTYVPTADDIGKTLTVRVTAWKAGFVEGLSESFPTAPVTADPDATPEPTPAPTPTPTTPPAPVVTPPAPVVTPAPVITAPVALAAILEGVDVKGKAKVGKPLKLSGLDKLFRASTPVSYSFKWFAGKKAIKKATKSKLKVTRAMKGKKLSVKVTAKAASAKKSVKLKVGKVR